MREHDRHRWVLELPLRSDAKAVLHVLAHRANGDSLTCFTSMRRLAADAGMSVRHARKVVGHLRLSGLIAVKLGGGTAANLYTLKAIAPAQYASLPGTVCPGSPAQQVGDPGTIGHSPRHNVPPNKSLTVLEQDDARAPPTVWDVWDGIAPGSRSLLGKLIHDHSEQAVAEAIATVDRKRPADPVSYLRGVLNKRQRSASTDCPIGSAV